MNNLGNIDQNDIHVILTWSVSSVSAFIDVFIRR